MRAEKNANQPERANVLGVGLSAINLDAAVATVAKALEQRIKGYVCVTGVIVYLMVYQIYAGNSG